MRYELREKVIRISPVLTEPVTFEIADDETIAYIIHAANYAGIGPTAIVATIRKVTDETESQS